mmetsp:Transcript_35475/g.31973  ORF Transcript_35475/g.31973 Transcript_35475/m.31973 type:complete len:81 (-) Transcript_35475:1461-1703(-)
MVEPATKEYQSQFVEERYFKKPVPKFNLGEIIRVEHIMKSHEEYYDKVCVVAGWSRTLRKAGGGKLIFLELNDGSCFTSL